MKKTIALILALLLCISMAACGAPAQETTPPTTVPATTAPKGIPLTIENCQNYLNISAGAYATNDDTHPMFSVQSYNGGMGMKTPGGYTWYVYPLLRMTTRIQGASTNFNYFDIEVTIKYTGTYQPGDPLSGEWKEAQTFEQLVTVKLNIGGEGFDQQMIDLGNYLHDDMMEYTWEVVDIKGYVDKA